MGNRIVQQPDGRYAVFSTIVDDFVAYDATEQQLVNFFVNEAMDTIKENVRRAVEAICEGKVSHRGYSTMTMAEAVQTIRNVHRKDADDRLLLVGIEPRRKRT